MVDAPSREKPPPDSPAVLALVAEGLPLVDILARQLRRQCGAYVHLDDLTSQGREALLAAARSFDPDRGVRFSHWAHLRIRGGMLDGVRSSTNVPRRVYRKLRALQVADRVHENAAEELAAAPAGTAEAADAKLTDQLGTAAMAMALAFLSVARGEHVSHAVDPGATPEEAFGNAELRLRVREAIAERPEAERRLIERHYFDEVTFDEAARELGLSKSWASRLHARAVQGIAESIKAKNAAAEPEPNEESEPE